MHLDQRIKVTNGTILLYGQLHSRQSTSDMCSQISCLKTQTHANRHIRYHTRMVAGRRGGELSIEMAVYCHSLLLLYPCTQRTLTAIMSCIHIILESMLRCSNSFPLHCWTYYYWRLLGFQFIASALRHTHARTQSKPILKWNRRNGPSLE